MFHFVIQNKHKKILFHTILRSLYYNSQVIPKGIGRESQQIF